MKERCPDSKPVSSATLPNYKLIFVGWSRQWQGGLASIRRVQGGKVSGVVYEISDKDLNRLDKAKGFPNDYNRIKVIVFDEDGTAMEAVTYVKTGQPEDSQPSKEYASIIYQGYREWGIV
ncbi:MAG: gamma-glutamylcyclotransferase [Dehalococcoidales bacterium]|nr:gamma-glutamylcyclotransferase [Dehalococcoidales bacterium]